MRWCACLVKSSNSPNVSVSWSMLWSKESFRYPPHQFMIQSYIHTLGWFTKQCQLKQHVCRLNHQLLLGVLRFLLVTPAFLPMIFTPGRSSSAEWTHGETWSRWEVSSWHQEVWYGSRMNFWLKMVDKWLKTWDFRNFHLLKYKTDLFPFEVAIAWRKGTARIDRLG